MQGRRIRLQGGVEFSKLLRQDGRLSAEGQPSRAEPGSEDDIVIDLKAGHAAATERFVREHIGWMLAVANRILRDSHHAEDAVQNAFAKIFDKLSSFDGRAAVKTWMHRILVNECLMLMRKAGRMETVPIDDLLPVFDANGCRIEERWMTTETPESLALQADTKALVSAKIGQLPDSYRVVLVLRDIEEMSTGEVAESLGISEANVKVRLHRARAALKRLLEPLFKGQME